MTDSLLLLLSTLLLASTVTSFRGCCDGLRAAPVPSSSRRLIICHANEPTSSSVVPAVATTVVTILLSFLLVGATPSCRAADNKNYVEWHLMNGDVVLPDPVVLNLEGSNNNLQQQLKGPTLIGAGGGGAVFAFDNSESLLLKVSWEGSTQSVQNECHMLKQLEANHVGCTEKCLGEFAYDGGQQQHDTMNERQRVMIVVEPYVRNAVASVSELPLQQQSDAVQQIARTLVQMLAANIITIDVQPLMDASSGAVTLIDMTEARQLSPQGDDTALMTAFLSEMATLIPDPYLSVASSAIRDEMQRLEQQGKGLSDTARDVLYESQFFPDESAYD